MPGARTTTYDYQQSSESGRERHILIPYARQTDAIPTLHDPVEAIGLIAGLTVTGTNITLDAVYSTSVVNVADGAVYRHGVRNCTGYGGGPAENAWAVINVGDPVFYDAEQDALTGNKLSMSALTSTGAANTLFGHVLMMQDEVAGDFPKTAGVTPGAAVVCAVMQV